VETTPAFQEPQVVKVYEERPKLSLGLAMIQWLREKSTSQASLIMKFQ
jgi:hypothetical protein